MAQCSCDTRRELERILRGTPWLMEILEAVRDVAPAGSYVGAGTIRNTVWNFLHDFRRTPPIGDVDVIHFTPEERCGESDVALKARLPRYRWELTNQATVHRWQSAAIRRDVAEYASLADAMSAWPETATAVAVSLDPWGDLRVLAPHGLADLFALMVRPSPGLLDIETYLARVREKQWSKRWPRVTVL